MAGIYNISVDDLLQLTIELDRNIYYDASAPTPSSDSLAEFLEYFNNPANQKKYQHCSILEKEVLFYFEKLSEGNQKEIIEFAKIKARKKQ